MAAHMETENLERFLVHILTPVYRVTEDDTVRDPQMGKCLDLSNRYLCLCVSSDELKALAVELVDMVRSKVGTTKFSAVYNQIRQSVLGIQRDRKAIKVLQVATNPEAAARRKSQKNSVKKESRKRKTRVFA